MLFETENRALESGLLPKICIIIMSTQAINEFHLNGDSIKPGILNVYQEMTWNTFCAVFYVLHLALKLQMWSTKCVRLRSVKGPVVQ